MNRRTPLTLPPDIPAVGPDKPATALAALDAIAVRCKSMFITFASAPATGAARMQASIEAGSRFLKDPLCATVNLEGASVTWGWAKTTREAFALIKGAPNFHADPDTLGARISRGPVNPTTFRELARMAFVATFGVGPAATGRKATELVDPVVQLEQAFARAKRMYINSSATTLDSAFNIHSEPLSGGGKAFTGSFWRSSRTMEAATFGDMVKKLAALPRKPTITDPASIVVFAPGCGLGAKQLKQLVLQVLDRALGPRHLLRPS